MNEIKFSRKSPRFFYVIDLEHNIRGHETGLNGTEIHAKDLRFRVLVGEIDGPDPRPAADVKNLMEYLV